MPSRPSSPSFVTTASGIQPSSSQRPACGLSSACENSRAMSRTIRCSSVRKSVCARVSKLLRVLLDIVDLLGRLLVYVCLERLRLIERLDLRAVRPFPRAIHCLALLGGGVHRGLLRLATARDERRGQRERDGHLLRPANGDHTRTAFTRCRISARTFGGRWFHRTPATAPARARHAGRLLRSGCARRNCSHASQKPTRIRASSESRPTPRSSAASPVPRFGGRSMGVPLMVLSIRT